MRHALFALAILTATPAAADRPEVLEACMENAGATSAEAMVLACGGVLSESCGQSATTTPAIAECLMTETRAWDTLLNRYWKPLSGYAKEIGIFEGLLEAQRAWIAFRDAECAYLYDTAGGGTIRTIYAADCQRRLTALRAAEFYIRRFE